MNTTIQRSYFDEDVMKVVYERLVVEEGDEFTLRGDIHYLVTVINDGVIIACENGDADLQEYPMDSWLWDAPEMQGRIERYIPFFIYVPYWEQMVQRMMEDAARLFPIAPEIYMIVGNGSSDGLQIAEQATADETLADLVQRYHATGNRELMIWQTSAGKWIASTALDELVERGLLEKQSPLVPTPYTSPHWSLTDVALFDTGLEYNRPVQVTGVTLPQLKERVGVSGDDEFIGSFYPADGKIYEYYRYGICKDWNAYYNADQHCVLRALPGSQNDLYYAANFPKDAGYTR